MSITLYQHSQALEEMIKACQAMVFMWWEHLSDETVEEIDDFCCCIAIHENKLATLELKDIAISVGVYVVLYKDLKGRVRSLYDASLVRQLSRRNV